MKRIGFTFFSMLCACVFVVAYAQTSVPLTPMQREMLKLPGNHLCGDAVTNVSCDELKEKQHEWHAEKVARTSHQWKTLLPGQVYALKPIEHKPNILLVATQGPSLSEPVSVGFYVFASPVCNALTNPVDGPATGPVGTIGLVEIDGKDYALDGECDGGNLTMVPSYWVTRKALLDSIRNDPVLAVRFKPGALLHYPTHGFSKVLSDLGVSLSAANAAN